MISSMNRLFSLNSYMSSLYASRASSSLYAKGLSSIYSNRSAYSYENASQTIMNNATKNTMNFASENVANMKSLQTAASNLNRAAMSLGTQTLGSSDNKVVSSNSRAYSSASYDVDVSAIAQKQVSESQAMKSTGTTNLSAGYHTLEIESGGKSTSVRFFVNEGDDNATVMKSIAKSINNAFGANVTAGVTQEKGQVRLSVSGKETGAKNGFGISFNGDELSMSVKTEAQDASYSVNGKSYTSASNTVSLPDSSAQMTLKGEGSAKLSRKVDTDTLVNAATDFVNAYNRAVSHLGSKTGAGAGVNRALGMITTSGLSRLSSMGITMGKDGKLSLDGDKLAKAASTGSARVQSMLGGYGSVSERVESGAGRAMTIPAATYTNFSSMQVSNSLIQMLMPGTGSLFDFRI